MRVIKEGLKDESEIDEKKKKERNYAVLNNKHR